MGGRVAPGDEFHDGIPAQGVFLGDGAGEGVLKGTGFTWEQRQVGTVNLKGRFRGIPVVHVGIPFKTDAIDGIGGIDIGHSQVKGDRLAGMIDAILIRSCQNRKNICFSGIVSVEFSDRDVLLPQVAFPGGRAVARVISVFAPAQEAQPGKAR